MRTLKEMPLKPGKVLVVPEHRFVSSSKPHIMNERLRLILGLTPSDK